jgi:class 3 adenylate cyclase
MKCPACGFINLPEARFCGYCGARLVQDCGICGLANPLEYRFCHRCGAPLTPSSCEAVAAREPLTHEAPNPPLTTTAVVPAPVALPDLTPVPSEATETVTVPPALQTILESRLEGERRIATIILADVKSSTDLLERLGTEAWVAMMNHVFQILETEIYRLGGKVDQFRGDGLVAFFGAATAHEDDPERAVLAALAMQEALRPYAAELAAQSGIDLSMRVGVNTGEVIVTNVGDRRKHSEDTAMGEAIALAARMEAAAEPGGVLVSENTYRLAADHFEWAPLGEIMVKGISHPIAVYRPLRPAVAQNETYGLTQPLIGREEEFQTLKTNIESLYAGRGGIVMLTGERGMGKSLCCGKSTAISLRQHALLTEACDRDDCNIEAARRELAAIPAEERMLRGRARSYDQSKPYALWVDLLRHWLDIPQNEARRSPASGCAGALKPCGVTA